jgi:hypothetical protein
MKKFLLVLLSLVIFLVPSVAYADTSEVGMVEMDAESVLDSFTEEVFRAKNEALEKKFAEDHPELYQAFKTTSDTPYGFNMNVNLTAFLDYPEVETVNPSNIRKVFGNMYMNGYINLPKEAMEMKMDVSFDAGELMSQSFQGIELILKENMMYMFNPLYGMWETEELTYSDVFEYTGNPMEQNNLGLFGPIADLMSKRDTLDSSIYSLRMTEEEIKQVVDGYVGMPIYDQLIAEVESQGLSFEVPSIEIDYVVQNGVIRVQHTEINAIIEDDELSVNLNIALDAEYYSYGLQKEIQAPIVDMSFVE